MKKRFVIVGLCLSLILTMSISTGCAGTKDNETPEAMKVGDYFPIRDNVEYVYEGAGNEYASYNVFTEYTSSDKVQQRVDNGGSVLARVLEVKDGKLTRLLFKGETYYRENLLNTTDNKTEILLSEPLEKGNSWELAEGSTRTITSLDEEVTTPLGSYKAIKVVTENPDQPGQTTTDYYAKDVGLVKTVFLTNGEEISSSLKEIVEDTQRKEVIHFYYPNIEDEKYYIKDREVSFRTNDVTGDILAQAYKEAPDNNLGKVFSQNTKINDLYLNQDNKVVLDLNSAFKTEMNAGSNYEGMILQSIANTFGGYYNSQEVILTIEGKPYTSGHFEMKEGESIKVDFSKVVQ